MMRVWGLKRDRRSLVFLGNPPPKFVPQNLEQDMVMLLDKAGAYRRVGGRLLNAWQACYGFI